MSQRSRILLDGKWQFWIDPENSLSPALLEKESISNVRAISVPAAWQSQFEDLRFYSGAAWYRRDVEIPQDWFDNERLFIRIGAADYCAQVWFNEEKIGEHEGGYLPFEFEVTNAARPGANTVTIRVDDPPHLFPEIPHGKQGWYGPLSGIWQSVWLERRPACHIGSLKLDAERKTGWVQAEAGLVSPGIQGLQLRARIIDPSGVPVVSLEEPVLPGVAVQRLRLQVPSPLDWAPDQPNLYLFEIELLDHQGRTDSFSKRFGFRTIETRNGQILLNDEPLYLRGALDQDYYPGTIASPPSEAYLEDQILKAKELGLNCLRCHIKVADPRYYDVADRLGMLVWTELPNWSVFTGGAGRRGRKTIQGILERDGHHPSIVIWTIINEDWGMDLVNQPAHRQWLKETYQWLKSEDPTRLIVDNSPCEPSFHIQTDIEDYHFYRAIPDHRQQWDDFVRSFAGRPAWTFCPNGLAERTGEEPLIVSEFGNWGLPDIDLLVDEHGGLPWWCETGFDWEHGVVYPQGVRSRFQNLGLERVFGSWRNLVEATQWQQYAALKYEIESMRRHPEISGYVITELTDVHWECNGLLDMHRNPKVFQGLLGAVNSDTVIIPEWERVAYWPGEQVRMLISIAHGARLPLTETELNWWLEDSELSGRLIVPQVDPGQSVLAGEVCFPTPDLVSPTQQRLRFELRSTAGVPLAYNHLDLTFYPARWISPLLRESKLYIPIPSLAERVRDLGYSLAERMESAAAVVVDSLDSRTLAYLEAGGRVLALSDRAIGPDIGMPAIRRAARAGTPWCGDWASSFTWINRRGVFSRFPGGPLIDHSFDRVIPEYVLTGFREWDFASLVRAGLFVGWIHKPAAIVGERYYGNGKAVLNTFRLADEDLGNDPTATTLLDALIELTLC